MKKRLMQMVMGIDPSLRSTGLCVMTTEAFNYRIVESGILSTVKKKNTSSHKETASEKLTARLPNLFQIKRFMNNQFQTHTPEVVVIEGYSYGSKVALPLQGEVTASIVLATEDLKTVPLLIVVPPTSVKKFITGKGSGKKELVLKEVYRRFGFDTDNNNIADAFVLCLIAWHAQYFLSCGRFHKTLTKEQKVVLMKVRAVKELLKKGRK
jgi:Holliday junction resolvasome RuvABC endonuclease subunit